MLSSRRARFLALPAVVALLAGCQVKPKMVIEKLPTMSIISTYPPDAPQPRPAVGRTVKPPSRRVAHAEPGWVPGAVKRPWKWIVIHHSASDSGSAETFDRWHRARGWDELGYHFVITNGHGAADGLVQVGSRWTKQKWGAHTGGTPDNAYNNYGIGICLVGDFAGSLPTDAQLAALDRLLAFLVGRYDIDPGHVIGHRDAPGATTECPGDAMERYLCRTIRPRLAQQIAARH